MNLPENQSTKELLSNSLKNTYTDIRNRYKDYAIYWNSIWQIWKGLSPDWDGEYSGNFLHQEIPYELRFTDKKQYEGLEDEINPDLPLLESETIETIGNQNIIRENVKNFNSIIANKFGEKDYSNTGEPLKNTYIKSYAVNYIIEGQNGIENITKYYVKDYERFSEDYNYSYIEQNGERIYNYRDSRGNIVNESSIPSIVLYNDENLVDFFDKKPISLYANNKHYYIKWTGERYYATDIINQYDREIGELFEAPTNLTSNNSRNLEVYNETLGDKTYRLFNGDVNSMLRTDISDYNPEIITFNLNKSLNLLSYTIQADNSYGSYPYEWRIQGSNDKINWSDVHIILERDKIRFSSGQIRKFLVSNDSYYLYYRIRISKFHNGKYEISSESHDRAALKLFTFSGYTSYSTLNTDRVQPQLLGKNFNGDESEFENIKKFSEAIDENDYNHFSEFSVSSDNNKDLTVLKLYDRDNKITLNNIEKNIRQDNIIRKKDTEQIQKVLDKISEVLKLKDGWFDRNGRCIVNCQVYCQHGCQVSCQYCNTHQCHNQKCGTH